MVDNLNPTNQFHPYQPQTATPNADLPKSGLSGILEKVGIDQSKLGSLGDTMKNMDVKKSVEKARGYAQKNPGMILGGMAALVIGAGLLLKRRNAK